MKTGKEQFRYVDIFKGKVDFGTNEINTRNSGNSQVKRTDNTERKRHNSSVRHDPLDFSYIRKLDSS